MIKTYRIEPSPQATAFPEPLAANRQHPGRGPAPDSVPDRPLGAPPRRPTQGRNHETYQSDPDGVTKASAGDHGPPAGASPTDAEDEDVAIAVTPDEAINAFGRRR
ncbi:MAG: hypothetical protein AB7O56_12180 [Bauldia sp.]